MQFFDVHRLTGRDGDFAMSFNKPLRQIIIASAVIIFTFMMGFVTGGIHKVYNPDDCIKAPEQSGSPKGTTP